VFGAGAAPPIMVVRMLVYILLVVVWVVEKADEREAPRVASWTRRSWLELDVYAVAMSQTGTPVPEQCRYWVVG
jgi:hypothetical protein